MHFLNMALGNIYKKKKKKKKIGWVHKNAAQTSKNVATELIFGLRLANVAGVAAFLPNVAQRLSIAAIL